MNCKHCGKKLRNSKYDLCYTCRIELNKKPKRYCTHCGKELHSTKYDVCYICRIELNKKPTIYCEHENCHNVVKSTSTSFDKTGKHLCTEHYNEWKHTHKYCKHCHQEYAEFSLNEDKFDKKTQKYCNHCLQSENEFSIISQLLDNNASIKNDLRKRIFNNTLILNYFYNKLFNKSTCKTLENFNNMSNEDVKKLSKIINQFIEDFCDSNDYSLDDNAITIWHLIQMAKGIKGWYLSEDLFNQDISEMSFENELFGVYTVYENLNYDWKQKENFISSLQSLKINSKQGKGEVFLSLLCTNVSAENTSTTGDICMMKDNKKTLCELKYGDSKESTGRLCFARINWVSVLNKLFKNYKDKLLSYSYLTADEKFLINTTVINEFTFEVLYKNIMYSIWQRNKHAAKDFCLYMINNFMFNYDADQVSFTYRFIDKLDFSNDLIFDESWNKFTFFAMINSLKYYFEVDAKSENLDSIGFMSVKKFMYITRDIINNGSYEELQTKLANLVYVWPSSEVTKKDNNENDRNKNRAPGAFVK